MSCRLISIGSFRDISSVKKYLFPDSQESAEYEGDIADWGDSWGDQDWDMEGDMEDDTEASQPLTTDSWLQSCHLSLSPCQDVMILANDTNMLILAQSTDTEDKSSDESKFSILWRGSPVQDEKEKITCVMCLPLASQKRSTQGGPDWTCIVVGFSTGHVRMYTENGTLLLSQLLHEGPVIQLKFKSYEPPRYAGLPEQNEELTILYKRALLSIDGFSLFQSLRACRSNAARAAASGSESLQPPPLAYKKWSLQEQEHINGVVSCGTVTPNPFDHMATASLLGGFDAKIKSSPPASSVYLTTGEGPYVGFYYALEGSVPPLISEVAYAMAHKLKSKLLSAASGWLGFGAATESTHKEKTKLEPATPLSHRCGLPDRTRVGESIVISPNAKLAAVTDSFGRVMLIDVMKRQVVRMWKGYRYTQLGWVQVDEDSHSRDHGPSKKAMFLVIYASRRGILEIWLAEQGPRVAAFAVDKNCQLVCPSYTLIGLNNTNYRGIKGQVVQCCLIDGQGTIKSIDVPFHLALSDMSNKRAKDIHLLKEIKRILKESQDQSGDHVAELKSTIDEIKSASSKKLALERVLHDKNFPADLMVEILDYVHDECDNVPEERLRDMEIRILRDFCIFQKKLISSYKDLVQMQVQQTHQLNTQSLQSVLGVCESEVTHITSQLEAYSDSRTTPGQHVTFEDDQKRMDVSTFISYFHCDVTRHSEGSDDKPLNACNLRENLTDEKQLHLAQFMLNKCLIQGTEPSSIATLLCDLGISPEQALRLVIALWLSEEKYDLQDIYPLIFLMRTITEMKDLSEIVVQHNMISKWWQAVRGACCQSTQLGGAFILAIAGRSLTIEATASFNKSLESEEETMELSDWEAVSLDVELWNLLIKRLEDILALNVTISTNTSTSGIGDVQKLSVATILDGGRGTVGEVLARWVCSNDIPIDVLLPVQPHVEDDTSTRDNIQHITTNRFTEIISKLRHRFPHSLETDVILSNCAWEYSVAWNKDAEAVDRFISAIKFLSLTQNAYLQHGICMMMYQMFIVKKLEAAKLLIQKVGKAPKDRLCRRDVCISDKSLAKLLGAVCSFLQVMMQANCDASDVPLYQCEDLWQEANRATSLTDLALNQKMSNYSLVQHHWTISCLMHAVMTFQMKSVKIMELFDTKSQLAFFKDLNSHPYFCDKSVSVDIKIIKAREQFITRVLDHALQVCYGKHMETPGISKEEAATWPSMLVDLCEAIDLNMDVLRQHHTKSLYSYGQDTLAEQVLLGVTDKEEVASKLLTVAGQRLGHYVWKCDAAGSASRLSRVPPPVSTWLKNMDSNELYVSSVSLQDTAILLRHIVNFLPETHAEHKLAESLIDLVQVLT